MIRSRPSAFTRMAAAVAKAAGRPATFAAACGIVVAWAACGPLFGFSDTWQLVINTGTTIVTFLMVFLIQNTQNRDGAALQAKLDELIETSRASNRFIGLEHLGEEEIEALRRQCEERAARPALRLTTQEHRFATVNGRPPNDEDELNAWLQTYRSPGGLD